MADTNIFCVDCPRGDAKSYYNHLNVFCEFAGRAFGGKKRDEEESARSFERLSAMARSRPVVSHGSLGGSFQGQYVTTILFISAKRLAIKHTRKVSSPFLFHSKLESLSLCSNPFGVSSPKLASAF